MNLKIQRDHPPHMRSPYFKTTSKSPHVGGMLAAQILAMLEKIGGDAGTVSVARKLAASEP
jgi:hypothetical protein